MGEAKSYLVETWIGVERSLKKLVSQIHVVPSSLRHLNRQLETIFIKPASASQVSVCDADHSFST